jgi:hypothetical protein
MTVVPFDWMPIEMPEPLRRLPSTRDEGHVGGFKAANHARFNAFFFNTGNHFAQNALMRYADDIDGLRQAESRADGDNHFVLLRALALRRLPSGSRRRQAAWPAAREGRRRIKRDRFIAALHLAKHLFNYLAQQFFINFHFSPLNQSRWDQSARDVFNLFPAFALQAIARCRTGIIVNVVDG